MQFTTDETNGSEMLKFRNFMWENLDCYSTVFYIFLVYL